MLFLLCRLNKTIWKLKIDVCYLSCLPKAILVENNSKCILIHLCTLQIYECLWLCVCVCMYYVYVCVCVYVRQKPDIPECLVFSRRKFNLILGTFLAQTLRIALTWPWLPRNRPERKFAFLILNSVCSALNFVPIFFMWNVTTFYLGRRILLQLHLSIFFVITVLFIIY